tara:strand:- start:304 stop:762 length:459 start_codon:yes stop_codon:yes gene_type:complete
MRGPIFQIKLFTISLLLLSFTALSNESKWNLIFQSDEVTIETKSHNCDFSDAYDQEFIFLRISNLTDSSLTLSYYLELWYDNKCINCENKKLEYEKSFKLSAREKIISDCLNKSNESKIFVKFSLPLSKMPGVNKIVKLTKFELKNISLKYE